MIRRFLITIIIFFSLLLFSVPKVEIYNSISLQYSRYLNSRQQENLKSYKTSLNYVDKRLLSLTDTIYFQPFVDDESMNYAYTLNKSNDIWINVNLYQPFVLEHELFHLLDYSKGGNKQHSSTTEFQKLFDNNADTLYEIQPFSQHDLSTKEERFVAMLLRCHMFYTKSEKMMPDVIDYYENLLEGL